MAVIYPEGLFYGERLAKCSDLARLYYPWLFLAANGYARLEIAPARIIATVFSSFREKPTEETIVEVLAEYQDNFLFFPYAAGGEFWGRFVCPDKCLKQYPTVLDKESPAEPKAEYQAFLAEYVTQKEERKPVQLGRLRTLAFSGEKHNGKTRKHNVSVMKSPDGFGVGFGVGEGLGEGVGGVASSPLETQPVVEYLPLNTGVEHPVTQKYADEMSRLYPAVDVAQSLRAMRAWLISNPSKRKTAGGITRFVNKWLAREQDQGGRSNGQQQPNKANERTLKNLGTIAAARGTNGAGNQATGGLRALPSRTVGADDKLVERIAEFLDKPRD